MPSEIVIGVLSMGGYFVLGAVGAGTYLFMLLLLDKSIAFLRNDKLPLPLMASIYIILGGVTAIIFNFSTNPDLATTQMVIAFTTGMGWPAIVSGISAGKKIDEINQAKQVSVKDLSEHFQEKSENMENQFSKMLQAKDTQIENIKEAIDIWRASKESEMNEIIEKYKETADKLGGGSP